MLRLVCGIKTWYKALQSNNSTDIEKYSFILARNVGSKVDTILMNAREKMNSQHPKTGQVQFLNVAFLAKRAILIPVTIQKLDKISNF
jgi:hypothetical protein